MKALAVVVAVLFALWLVGRMGPRDTAAPVESDAAGAATEAASGDAMATAVSAEAATQPHP